MKLGIKVGPQKQSLQHVQEINPPFVEVWFNIANHDGYTELFEQLNKRHIDIGLHFWGTIDEDIETNISFADPKILQQSRRLIIKCIDIAAKHNNVYVNIHPGGRILTKLDFIKEAFIATPQSQDQKLCEEALAESLTILTNAAHGAGVTLCVESIPPYAPGAPWSDLDSRNHPVYNDQMPLVVLERLIPHTPHLGFANDLAHTAGQVITSSRNKVYEFLIQKTKALAAYTRLIHVSYTIAPYIGTDYHGDVYNPICKTPVVVPTTDELTQILSEFKNRDDIYALAEPKTDHVGNYRFIKNLLEK